MHFAFKSTVCHCWALPCLSRNAYGTTGSANYGLLYLMFGDHGLSVAVDFSSAEFQIMINMQHLHMKRSWQTSLPY